MTSVLNRLRLLNGNNFLLLVFIFLTACSPKVVPVKEVKPTSAPVPAPVAPAERSKKFNQAKLAMLLPFQLKEAGTTVVKADVERAEMAIDFYQGFLLGIDSASTTGQNFKVNVVDSKGFAQQLGTILKREEVRNADLLIGPVFPESLRQLKGMAPGQFIISPLAATMPEEFDYPRLISLTPGIRLHAEKIASYILAKPNPAGMIVVLINPKNADSEVLGSQLRKLLSPGGKKFIFQEYATVGELETKFQGNKQYEILISSTDKSFVVQSLEKLSKIKKRFNYPMEVIGHPNWARQTYNTEQLQELNTMITSSYRVNYKRTAVISFIKKYRSAYNFEPGEYAFKGFDTGVYFGRLLAKYGSDYPQYLTKEKYSGLQNSYSFLRDENLGYINTGLMLLRYKNYTLNLVE